MLSCVQKCMPFPAGYSRPTGERSCGRVPELHSGEHALCGHGGGDSSAQRELTVHDALLAAAGVRRHQVLMTAVDRCVAPDQSISADHGVSLLHSKELFRQSLSILIEANCGDLRPSQVRDRFLHLENPAVVKPAPDERVKRQRQMRGKADAPPRAAVKLLQRIPADQHK